MSKSEDINAMKYANIWKWEELFVKEQRGKPQRKGVRVGKCLLKQKSMKS